MADSMFQGLEQLLELAKQLEAKVERGELKAHVQVRSSSIPRQGNIPRGASKEPVVTPPVQRPNQANNAADQDAQAVVQDIDLAAPAAAIDLSEIGGLDAVLTQLREVVELPLRRPELFRQLGLEPPRGVLLVGPPGTGKTLTARALATNLGVNYIAVVGPELLSKYYGEAEAKLRQVFEKARQAAPCLVFIDEIDALAPNREQVEGEVEKRLVAQLLGLLDGFEPLQGVVVLAATNRPDHLDPALRRPGRFDREVVFGVPDREGRLAILQIQTRPMPLAADVDLLAIATAAVGFVGADLKALTQAAAYAALRRVDVQTCDPATLRVDQADFAQALHQIRPAVLRSVAVEVPNVPWSAVGGLEPVKQTLQETLEAVVQRPQLYSDAKIPAPRGVLLYGPPGTGKTLLAKAVATQAQANFISVSGPELVSKWVGESEATIREIFRKARQAAPCVIFFDEIDTLAPARGQAEVSDRVVGQLLTEMDGLQGSSGILVIAATNRPSAIDPALRRAGRFDLQLAIDLPDATSRLSILQVHNAERPLGLDLMAWAATTEGWNGAELALLSNQAALLAVRRAIATQTPLQVIAADFEQAYAQLQQQRLHH